MAPIIGYSNTRVNPTYSAENKGEYGQWLYAPISRPVKVMGNLAQPVENRNRQASFATLLKQAEQDNNQKSSVELRPTNRQTSVDILA